MTTPKGQMRRSVLTGPERLLEVLFDGAKHATSELVARVGHTFLVFKWVLTHRDKYVIHKERHPTLPFEYNYWLGSEGERGRRRARLAERIRSGLRAGHARSRSLAPVVL